MIEKLFTSFGDIFYNDTDHTYNNGTLISVTQFLTKKNKQFNEDYESKYKALQYSGRNVKRIYNGKSVNTDFITVDGNKIKMDLFDWDSLKFTPDYVKKSWEETRLLGTEFGSFIHSYAENLGRRWVHCPELITPIVTKLSPNNQLEYIRRVQVGMQLVKRFYKDHPHLHTIVSEFTIGSEELKIAGTFDRLFFNTLTNEYELWDFKTDKQITFENQYDKFEGTDIECSSFNKYSLQLSMYRYIIRYVTGIDIKTAKVCWFNHTENEYRIIETKDYTDLIKQWLQ